MVTLSYQRLLIVARLIITGSATCHFRPEDVRIQATEEVVIAKGAAIARSELPSFTSFATVEATAAAVMPLSEQLTRTEIIWVMH